MKQIMLGRTGITISEVGFGCIPIIRLSTDEAVKVLRHGFDRGITFYDTANAYKDSENKIGLAFAGMRDKVVLATKTQKRDAEGTMKHLDRSLSELRTDYIDLYQFHQVAQEKDWQAITAPGGALEAMVKAKEAGKIRHLGITSHSLTMAITLMKTGLFSTIMFPFNFIEDAAKEEMLPLAQELNIAFIAMKPFAGGVIDNGALAFKFLRQYPDAIVIPGFESAEGIDEILSYYEKPTVVTAEDRAAMEQYRQEVGKQFCRRCEYCQPCPHGVMITPAMSYQVVVRRLSPAKAVDFSRMPMESVSHCTECGACIARCPYDLPIPATLKKNKALYDGHKQEHGS